MRIKSVSIRHFRSIRKLELSLSGASVLAGPNSCGKSNVLRAIRFAFVETYAPERVAANFPVFVPGPAAEISVSITFDKATAEVAAVLGILAGTEFTYGVVLKRNGKSRYTINGKPLLTADRSAFLALMMVVYVPPIRDISVGGLDPLKGLLAKALRNAKKGQSITTLNSTVRAAFIAKGAEVLDKAGAGGGFGSFGALGKIGIDAAGVDISVAVEQLGLLVDLDGAGRVPLSALGTGHQSQVVMNLFGSLGAAFSGQVIYMFEEPDNHLHPTALLTVAESMRRIVEQTNSQVLLSSHSASFVGAFPISDVIILDLEAGATLERKRSPAVSQRRIHALMARYGIKPIEALLARSVILVEGPSDVTMVRAMSRVALGYAPEQRDVLVVPCGGKKQIVELYRELHGLGVQPCVVFDKDAAMAGSPAYFSRRPAAADVRSMRDALVLVRDAVSSEKIKKSLISMIGELDNGPPPAMTFGGSPVDDVAKQSSKLNAVSLSKLPSAFSGGKRKNWREHLDAARIWVWSKDPEEIFAEIPGSLATINVAAVAAGAAVAPLVAGATNDVIQGWLHNQASEPAIHEAVLASLMTSIASKRGELWEFAKFLGVT